MNNSVFLVMVIMFLAQIVLGQELKLNVGDVIYQYSTALVEEPSDIEEARVHHHDFSCVQINKILESDIPRTDFIFEQPDNKMLLGILNGVLYWKGIDGMDPFLGVEKYLQFRGGVPLYNFEKPTSFDYKDEFKLYIDYKVDQLPEDLKEWTLSKGYGRLKLKVILSYETKLMELLYTREDKSNPSQKLSRDILFEVISLQGKETEEWEDIMLSSHPILEKYFSDILQSDIRICDRDHPLGAVVFQRSPELKLSFFSTNELFYLPACEPGGNQVYVYPNPSFGQLNLSAINIDPGSYSLEIFNLVGYKLWSQALQMKDQRELHNFDLSFLDKGVYVYALKDYRGAYVQTRRLIIVEH